MRARDILEIIEKYDNEKGWKKNLGRSNFIKILDEFVASLPEQKSDGPMPQEKIIELYIKIACDADFLKNYAPEEKSVSFKHRHNILKKISETDPILPGFVKRCHSYLTLDELKICLDWLRQIAQTTTPNLVADFLSTLDILTGSRSGCDLTKRRYARNFIFSSLTSYGPRLPEALDLLKKILIDVKNENFQLHLLQSVINPKLILPLTVVEACLRVVLSAQPTSEISELFNPTQSTINLELTISEILNTVFSISNNFPNHRQTLCDILNQNHDPAVILKMLHKLENRIIPLSTYLMHTRSPESDAYCHFFTHYLYDRNLQREIGNFLAPDDEKHQADCTQKP